MNTVDGHPSCFVQPVDPTQWRDHDAQHGDGQAQGHRMNTNHQLHTHQICTTHEMFTEGIKGDKPCFQFWVNNNATILEIDFKASHVSNASVGWDTKSNNDCVSNQLDENSEWGIPQTMIDFNIFLIIEGNTHFPVSAFCQTSDQTVRANSDTRGVEVSGGSIGQETREVTAHKHTLSDMHNSMRGTDRAMTLGSGKIWITSPPCCWAVVVQKWANIRSV